MRERVCVCWWLWYTLFSNLINRLLQHVVIDITYITIFVYFVGWIMSLKHTLAHDIIKTGFKFKFMIIQYHLFIDMLCVCVCV